HHIFFNNKILFLGGRVGGAQTNFSPAPPPRRPYNVNHILGYKPKTGGYGIRPYTVNHVFGRKTKTGGYGIRPTKSQSPQHRSPKNINSKKTDREKIPRPFF
ncbi:MAG: hypothetical protein LBT30_03140, partial [Clostridiales bacterium]|nr:hypothetical protein [Clostridiales bacterium]